MARLQKAARQAGVKLSDLSKWERGLETPSDTDFHKLAAVLECETEALKAAHERSRPQSIPGEGYTTVPVAETIVHERRASAPKKLPKVLDLFCGCGGFSYGVEQTGSFAVTAGIDLLPDRIETFKANHPHATAIAADIRTFPIDRLAAAAVWPDVLIGGPPCQGFSSLRPFRTLTEGDPRNTLFEHFILVVDHVRPRWFVLENVVGLLAHGKGGVFRQIIEGFTEAGYATEYRVLNAARHGLPQNREGLVVVGNGEGKTFPWPEPTHYTEHRSMAGRHKPVVDRVSPFRDELPSAVTVMEAIHDLAPVEAGRANNSYVAGVGLTGYERVPSAARRT